MGSANLEADCLLTVKIKQIFTHVGLPWIFPPFGIFLIKSVEKDGREVQLEIPSYENISKEVPRKSVQ